MTSTARRAPEDFSTPVSDASIETTRFDRRSASISVRGDLDVAIAAQLWSVLQQNLLAGRRFLRLDLSAVTFVDAAAVTAIVEVHHEALYRRGTLVLVGVTSLVAKVLSLTGVDDLLLIAGPRSDNDQPNPRRAMAAARDLLGSRAWPSPRR
jgi:anti-anti-sigma factor